MNNNSTSEKAPTAADSSPVKDNLYVLDGGTILTTPGLTASTTVRRSVSILLSLGGPIDLCVGQARTRQEAVVVKPLVRRLASTQNARFVAFFVNAMHPQFPAFRTIPASGFLVPPRSIYRPVDAMLEVAFAGKLDAHAARALHTDVVALTARCLAPAGPVDPRIDAILALLRSNPNYRLQDLARATGLSASRMSHLFSDSMGLSLRSYILWFKMNLALELAETEPRFTDAARVAGFVDLAHFSREFQRAFGANLSYFYDASRVRIFQYRTIKLMDQLRAAT